MPEAISGLEIDIRLDYPEFSLEVSERLTLDTVVALFGPSGAGKSTLLRVIAGLAGEALGTLSFDGSSWLDTSRGLNLPPHMRAVGMVFQEPYLFPHLRVAGNLQFAIRRRRNRTGPDHDSVVAALDLQPLLRRDVSNLSGGQKQRVALGRALLSAPQLLLLDEPLAAIDTVAKSEIMPYLQRVIREFAIPVIYVSHSAEEIRQLAGTVFLIRNGKVENHGNTSLLQGVENRAYLNVTSWQHASPGVVQCRLGETRIEARASTNLQPGCNAMLSIDTSRILLSVEPEPGLQVACRIPARIISVTPAGGANEASITLESPGGNFPVIQHVSPDGMGRYKSGRSIHALLLRQPVLVPVG